LKIGDNLNVRAGFCNTAPKTTQRKQRRSLTGINRDKPETGSDHRFGAGQSIEVSRIPQALFPIIISVPAQSTIEPHGQWLATGGRDHRAGGFRKPGGYRLL
jgi:hypothetical protein